MIKLKSNYYRTTYIQLWIVIMFWLKLYIFDLLIFIESLKFVCEVNVLFKQIYDILAGCNWM